MSRLHLFNPENDLALGLGCRHYTPPPHAAALHRAGELLPAWWADEGDDIVAPHATEADRAWLADRFGLLTEAAPSRDGLTPEPWGWSADAVRQFEAAGVRAEALPSPGAIEAMRGLSHRRSSVVLLNALGRDDIMTIETTDPDEAVEMEGRHPGCYIKSPWSGSGRGVFCARGLSTEVIRSKAAGIIHRQGSVMVERGLDKETDCAALFRARRGEVTPAGLSMFVTEPRGMYGGNIVAPQEWIKNRIASYVGAAELETTVAALAKALTTLIGDAYEGWLGVDMMVWRTTHGYALHPCVELNLRRTMGVVAMDVERRLCLEKPALMAWRHGGRDHHDTTLLLPPREGFALTLDTNAL